MCSKKHGNYYDNYSIVGAIGNSTARSENNKVFPPSVKITFMRYGLVKEGDEFIMAYPQKEEPEWQNPDGAPDVIDFKYVRTSLRPGWIYIYTEDTNKIYKYATNDGAVTPYVLLRDKTIWAAYSEVEWSAKYYCSMRDNASDREKRMQKISYTDWYNDQEIPGGVSYDNANAVFYQNDYYLPWQYKTDIANAFVNDNNEDKKEYVFFCLHDPLSVADVLAANLNKKWLEMEALLISMQTGLEKNIVLECLKNGMAPEKIAKKQEPQKREQIEALFKTALLLYQSVMAMDPTEGIDSPMNRAMANIPGAHYGGLSSIKTEVHLADNLDKVRIRKILGKEERDTLKTEISKSVNILVKFLESSYYQKIMQDYYENIGIGIIEGRWRIAIHYQALAYLPNAKDKYLDTAEDSKKWGSSGSKAGYNHIKKLIDNQIPAGKVFNTKASITVKNEKDVEQVLINFESIWSCLGEYVKNNPDSCSIFVKLLNCLELNISETGTKLNKFVEETDLFNAVNSKSLTKLDKEILNFDEEIWKSTGEASFSGGLSIAIKNIRFTNDFVEQLEYKGKWAETWSKSLRWNRFIADIAYINLGWAVVRLSSSNAGLGKGKNVISLISALASTYAIHGKIKQIKSARSGLLSKSTIESMGKLPSFIGALGCWLDAAIDIIDAGVNFSECDSDAALALIGSASCGILYGIGLLLEWPHAGMIVLLIAGFGLGFLAAYLEDSPFETLVKNNPLRSFGKNHKSSRGNYLQVINYNYNNRTQLAKQNFSEWGDYVALYESLTDILFAGRVALSTTEKKSDLKVYATVSETIQFTKQLKIEIVLPQPKSEIARIEYEMYILPGGIYSNYTPKKILPIINSKGGYFKTSYDKEGKIIYMLDYKVPDEYISINFQNADLLFYYRIHLYGNYIYPIEKNGQARYIAIKVRVKNTLKTQTYGYGNNFSLYYNDKNINQFTISKIFGDAIRTGTKTEILKPEKWN